MRRKTRDFEGFSISFLDVITCGFGAIVLLLMISKPAPPIAREKPVETTAAVADLRDRLSGVQGEVKVLGRNLDAKREQLSKWRERVARLESDLARLHGEGTSRPTATSADEDLKGKLERAVEQLTDEMRRLLAERRQVKSDLVGGIPVDSEYIVFVIDTSGSMLQFAWNQVLRELIRVLDLYPTVKGIQVMNDMGRYMFEDYRGEWIPDTPGRRKIILERLSTWNAFSNSSPVEGIEGAIRSLARPDAKMSIYYFGDDFARGSIARVLNEVERMNPKDRDGEPMVRIHAIGFPVQFLRPDTRASAVRFAHLMRELTGENRGTFVGLTGFGMDR